MDFVDYSKNKEILNEFRNVKEYYFYSFK